jgi:hypothetical protein
MQADSMALKATRRNYKNVFDAIFLASTERFIGVLAWFIATRGRGAAMN